VQFLLSALTAPVVNNTLIEAFRDGRPTNYTDLKTLNEPGVLQMITHVYVH